MFSHVSFAFILFMGFMYFIPSIVASRRKHPNSTPIMVLNLFLGWTVIGWVAALIWSLTSPVAKIVLQGTPASVEVSARQNINR